LRNRKRATRQGDEQRGSAEWCSIPKWSRGQPVTLVIRRFESARTPLKSRRGDRPLLARECVGWALASPSGRNPLASLCRFNSCPTHLQARGREAAGLPTAG